MEADRERRIGRLEGRQEMLLEWVSRLEQDLQRLRDRLADEGVLDYMEEVDTMQSNIESLKQKIEGEEFGENAGYTGLFEATIADPYRVAATVIIIVVLVLAIIALGREGIQVPFFSGAQNLLLVSPIMTNRLAGLSEHVPQPYEPCPDEQEECGIRKPPARF